MRLVVVILTILRCALAMALSPFPNSPLKILNGRRSFIWRGITAGILVGTAGIHPATANLPPCKPLADNCRSTSGGGDLPPFNKWYAPGKSVSMAWEDLVSAVEAYPEEGQGTIFWGIDGGGWRIVERKPGEYLKVEFTSRIFRFIDDLEFAVEPEASGAAACVRSASRVGDSDLGVNTQRVEYLARILRTKGWRT